MAKLANVAHAKSFTQTQTQKKIPVPADLEGRSPQSSSVLQQSCLRGTISPYSVLSMNLLTPGHCLREWSEGKKDNGLSAASPCRPLWIYSSTCAGSMLSESVSSSLACACSCWSSSGLRPLVQRRRHGCRQRLYSILPRICLLVTDIPSTTTSCKRSSAAVNRLLLRARGCQDGVNSLM